MPTKRISGPFTPILKLQDHFATGQSIAARIATASSSIMLTLTGLLFMSIALPAQVQTLSCTAPGGFGVVPPFAPPVLLASLKTVANPVIPKDPVTGLPTVRTDLTDYVANLNAAIQLGKALFWDMQAGSDNKTACATCHFQAGSDARNRNQLNPGANGLWDSYAANASLAPSNFPFTTQTSDVDNVAGSQGVRKCSFQGFSKSGAELTTSVADPVFSVNGVNVRQVTGKNAPSVINAVFNHRNFWNGRAQPEFNGVTPFGNRDSTARLWVIDPRGNPTQFVISIQNASLASQAVGPPLNSVEMSAAGRTFPDLGHKMLLLKPLGRQKVDANDSVLGSISDPTSGLKVTYTTLVQQAFQPKWWNSRKTVTVGTKSYTVMEANFSLFWGLSIMLYEATLVSDNTPMDQYLDSGRTNTATLDPVITRLLADLPTLTTQQVLDGLSLFELPVAPPPNSFPAQPGFGVGCAGCHVGAELTSASTRNLTGPGVEAGDIAFKNAGFDLRMERMFMNLPPVPLGTDAITFDPSTYSMNVIDINGAPQSPALPVPIATYDAGWYNIGTRPTADDPGLDGKDPFGNYLSWTRLFQAYSDPTFIKVPGNGLGCQGMGSPTFLNQLLNASGFPILSGGLQKNEATDIAGTFKVPGLRNTELTAPYFHHGGKATLAQVLDFYDGGGDFANATKAPAITPLLLSQYQQEALIAFLLSLTDERVRWQQAPFDHPELLVPNGDSPPGTDNTIDIPAVGATGSPTPITRFLGLNPFF